MNTKTILIILGVIAVVVIIAVSAKSKYTNNTSDINDINYTTPDMSVVTPDEEQPQVTPPTTLPDTDIQNPSFPTTGFEPNN